MMASVVYLVVGAVFLMFVAFSFLTHGKDVNR